MTASELITILNTLPGDMEITLEFSYCGDCGCTIEHHKILDIFPKGELKTECITEDFISYDEGYQYDEEIVYSEEDSMEYLESMSIADEIESAWKEYEASEIFQTAEEEEGYIEYQNTLYQQDRDLEELVTKAHKTAEEELINEINELLCNS